MPYGAHDFKLSPLVFLVPLLAAACVQAAALAAPRATGTVELPARCSGACAPSLVELVDGRVVALVSSPNGRLSAQLIDASDGALLGGEVDLGYLATPGGAFAQQPLAIPLPDGDLALVGLLGDGRVTFARGSENPARRVAPKVIVPATSNEVLDIAASSHGTAVALVALRASDGHDPKARRSPAEMNVELYALDATGRANEAPQRWTTEVGSFPRLASCAGVHYLTWQRNDDVIVTTIAADGERSPQRTIPGRKSLGWPGPIICDGGDAVLVASWQHDALAARNLAELSIARITSTATKLEWRTVKLPSGPRTLHVGEGTLAAHFHRGQLYTQVGTNARPEFVRLHLDAAKVQLLPLRIPPHRAQCLALAEGTRALCAAFEPSTEGACSNRPGRVLLSVVGYPTLVPTRDASAFWKVAAPIPDPQAPSASELAWRRSRVMCAEPGWSELREALEDWCKGDPKADDWRAEPSLCGRELERSLLYQAIHCTNEPSKCEPSRFRVVPSVDRAEFEQGRRIELSYANCSVYFSREQQSLRVLYGECTGE